MIDSVPSTDVADPERFERTGVAADAEGAGRTREAFSRWLADFFILDPTRSSDLVLATNEALANAAEFAYVSADRPGTMDVLARYRAHDGTLTVTVADQGAWRVPEPNPATRLRGRGIPLMQALTDRTTIERTPVGTRVCLEWSDVPRRAQ